MKDTQAKDSRDLKQPLSSWPEMPADFFRKAETDSEPFSKAPAPSAFRTPEILSRFMPEPLLAVTPEKSLQRSQVEKNARPTACGDGVRKGRQRVRFAPGTRSSPPSKNSSAVNENKGSVAGEVKGSLDVGSEIAAEEESMPRSFPAFSQKIYQPGRYADHDGGKDTKLSHSSASKSLSESSVPKRYTVETQGSKTVYVPMDQSAKNITSEYSDLHQGKPITAKIVRHKPATTYDISDDEASTTELKQAFESCLSMETPPQTPPRSRSTSPFHRHSSPHIPRKVSPSRHRASPASSPSRHCSSPSRSPGRLTPVEGQEFFTPDGKSCPVVQVIREAPYQPKRNDYVFPFEDGEEERQVYDFSMENPLARPEFNSALKISEELKSVKGKRPNTWGAVSQKLKTSDKKRTQIQEKASSRVNFQMQSGMYADLVDVDVPLDDLCQNVEKGIRQRAPSPKPSAVKVPVGKEPDIMEFFTPELQQELPDLTLSGVQPITESLTTANPMLAFDLYRHNRAWTGLTDS